LDILLPQDRRIGGRQVRPQQVYDYPSGQNVVGDVSASVADEPGDDLGRETNAAWSTTGVAAIISGFCTLVPHAATGSYTVGNVGTAAIGRRPGKALPADDDLDEPDGHRHRSIK
jgi:hypothetical protein